MAGRLNMAATYGIVLSLIGVLVGCEGMTPNSFNPNHTFLDQSEIAVSPTRGTLLVPILDKLNTNIDEPSAEFTNAGDIRPEDMVATASDYTVGKNDLVQVTIND